MVNINGYTTKLSAGNFFYQPRKDDTLWNYFAWTYKATFLK